MHVYFLPACRRVYRPDFPQFSARIIRQRKVLLYGYSAKHWRVRRQWLHTQRIEQLLLKLLDNVGITLHRQRRAGAP